MGVKICTNSNFEKNLKILFKTYDVLLVESFIGGQEIQVAVLNGKALGAIELNQRENFMTIRQNILSQQTNHIMPAKIPKNKYKMKCLKSLRKLIKF